MNHLEPFKGVAIDEPSKTVILGCKELIDDLMKTIKGKIDLETFNQLALNILVIYKVEIPEEDKPEWCLGAVTNELCIYLRGFLDNIEGTEVATYNAGEST